MTKKVSVICHSKRLNAVYPTVPRSSFYVEYELNYKSIYSCDFATLTRYNSRQTRFRAKIFAPRLFLDLEEYSYQISCDLVRLEYNTGLPNYAFIISMNSKKIPKTSVKKLMVVVTGYN